LPRDVLLGGDDNVGTAFKGAPPLNIWEGRKRRNFGAI